MASVTQRTSGSVSQAASASGSVRVSTAALHILIGFTIATLALWAYTMNGYVKLFGLDDSLGKSQDPAEFASAWLGQQNIVRVQCSLCKVTL